VVLDPFRLSALRLRPAEAASRVEAALVRRAVGRFEEQQQLVTVTAESIVSDAAGLARLPLSRGPDGPVALGSVASVFEGAPDRTRSVHAPEGDAVQVSVSRLPGAAAPDVVREVLRAAQALRLPEGIRLVEVYNQGDLIRDSVVGIGEAIVLGVVLTVGVLALFLRDVRAGLLAAASVPWTLVATFLVVYLAGESLNLMSLGGLAVAIGLVIDDAIVVVESIVRHLEEGVAPRPAIGLALSEITTPVVGTTLTTVVVFIPLAFLGGLIGRFFTALAVTLAGAVLLSLVFAVAVLPLLAERLLRTPAATVVRRRDALGAAYGRRLGPLLARPGLAAGLVLASLVLGGFALRGLASGFLPEMDEGAFVLDYFLPAGASLAATDSAALRLEDVLRRTPEVATWTRRTGAELGPVTATALNRGDIAVLLKPRGQRRESEAVIDDVRVRLAAEVPGVRVEFVQILEDVLNDLSGSPRPLEVRVLGPDHAEVNRLAGAVEAALEGMPRLVDYYRGVEPQVPLLRFELNGVAAMRAGLSSADVADDLATALKGSLVGEVPRLDRLVPVRVRFPDDVRFAPLALASLPISIAAAVVPISGLATPVAERTASVLLRENLSPAAVATGDVEGGDIGGLAREARRRLAGVPLPPGYRIAVGGQSESQAAAFRQLLGVLGLGLIAVFALLVAQFRSGRAAALVLLTIPPALAGGVCLLWIADVALNVSSLMGLVLLVGLVVKNGILLIENTLVRLDVGEPLRAALRRAARRRLRPILMTTLCTVFGLLPLALAFGAGSELQRPLAVAVIGGLVFSTAATLLLLPALAGVFLGAFADR
jgi:multidrug efflux pump subunit AcrB